LECRDWPAALTRARHAYVLAPPATDLVHALKYDGWSELADSMGAAVASIAASAPEQTSDVAAAPRLLVVPVPTTAARLRRRGYNQAELLARRVAAVRDLPLISAICRAGGGGSQTSLAPSERRENVRGAFRAVPSAVALVAGCHVLLVDDVLTTGATASEAALSLASMGAAGVTLLTYARALPNAPRRPA
jgi:ComF family protein